MWPFSLARVTASTADAGGTFFPGSVSVPSISKKINFCSMLSSTIGIEAAGVELLIHAGIDTVSMNGDGFTSHVKEGQAVKKGDLLLTMDLEKIKAAGHPATIMVIVTNSDDLSSVEAAASGKLMPGDQIMRLQA